MKDFLRFSEELKIKAYRRERTLGALPAAMVHGKTKEMDMDKKKAGQVFVGIFLAGVLLFNFPIMSIFNKDDIILELTSLLNWYLYGAWFLCIVAIWLATRFAISHTQQSSSEQLSVGENNRSESDNGSR